MARFQNPLTYPRELIEGRAQELLEAYPDLTFASFDVTRMIDAQVAGDGDPRVVTQNSVLAALQRLGNRPESHVHWRTIDDARDTRRSSAAMSTLMTLWSYTEPVPTYTLDMVELFNETPPPRTEPTYNPLYPKHGPKTSQDGNEILRIRLRDEITQAAERHEDLSRFILPEPEPEPEQPQVTVVAVPTPADLAAMAQAHRAADAAPGPIDQQVTADPAGSIPRHTSNQAGAQTKGEMLISLVTSFVRETESKPRETAEVLKLREENKSLRAEVAELKKQRAKIARALGVE
jgi:hypothetical protein